MKVQIKKLLKNNLNVIIAFALGIFLTGITVYAATVSFASEDVEHTYSNGSKTNVAAALNDLYTKANQGDATSAQILSGKKALSGGTLLTGTMADRGLLNWKPNTGTVATVEAGYYSGGTLDSRDAYNAGYQKGREQLIELIGKIRALNQMQVEDPNYICPGSGRHWSSAYETYGGDDVEYHNVVCSVCGHVETSTDDFGDEMPAHSGKKNIYPVDDQLLKSYE